MKKKAQITMFIIIALILLIAAATVLYLTSMTEKPGREVIVSPDVLPVYDYITACVDQIAEDGLDLMGWQGGYLYPPPSIARNPNSYIGADPWGLVITPMWYYQGEDRTPPLFKMEEDLSKYVLENIRDCIGDYGPLQNQFNIVEIEDFSARTTIADKDVVIELTAPMDIETKRKEIVTRIDQFIVVMPVQLKKMWELANKTMAKENEIAFMENLTIDFLAVHPDIPMDGMLLKCGIDTWSIHEIKKEFQEMLYYNLPRIRIEDTDYPPFIENRRVYEDLKDHAETIRRQQEKDVDNKIDVLEQFSLEDVPPDAYEYGKLLIDVDAVNAQDLKANLVYRPEWGMYLMAHPNDNGILRSNMIEGARKYLSYMCINSYHFAYDTYYPVMITIRDDKSYNGKGYVFKFAFPVVVINNEEGRERTSSLIFEDVRTDVGFCSTIGGEKVDIRVLGVYAGYTDMELDDVDISYLCVNKYCHLGHTQADEGIFRLRTYLPRSCEAPIIIAEKEGYLKTEGQLGGKRLDLQMTKVKEMKFRVFKHRYDSGTKALSQGGLVLGEGDEATIAITMRVPGQRSYSQYLVSGKNQVVELAEDDYRYDLEIMVNQFGKLIGGYSVKNVSISYGDVVDNEEIIFRVFDYSPLPQTDEQQMDMMMYYTGRTYADQLKPTFR
jgi:hypothetical protein